jgi:hypothetical protein
MQRKIEARWWVVHERLGAGRGAYDMAMQFLVHATRWAGGRLTGRDATPHAVWLRAGLRAVRAGRPALPPPLPGAPGAGR